MWTVGQDIEVAIFKVPHRCPGSIDIPRFPDRRFEPLGATSQPFGVLRECPTAGGYDQ